MLQKCYLNIHDNESGLFPASVEISPQGEAKQAVLLQ